MNREERLDDPEESLRLAIENALASTWTSMPGIVQSVNLTAQTVTVQPAIQGKVASANGSVKSVNLPVLVDVPLVWPRAGGFAITFPVQPGDEVLVIFACRCIDSWWQSGGVGVQAEARMHDLSDGFAILAPTSQPRKLADIQTDGVELRTDDRSTYLRLTNGTIYIKGNIVQEGETTISGKITGQSGMQVSGGAGVQMSGTITHTGGSITSNGKNIGSSHTHSGVQPGSGNTGAPN